MRQNYASNDGLGLACVLSNLGPVTRSCVVRVWKLRCYMGGMGGGPPCQPTARLPHRAARHRLGYEATCTVQGPGKLTGSTTYRAGGRHLSVPASLVQIRSADLARPLSRIGSPTTALQLPQRRHIIPIIRWLASMHPLATRTFPPRRHV